MAKPSADTLAIEASVNEYRKGRDTQPQTAVGQLMAANLPYWYGVKKTLLIMPKDLPGYLYNAHHGKWQRIGQKRLFKGTGIRHLIEHLSGLTKEDGEAWILAGHLPAFQLLVDMGNDGKAVVLH